jgi:hypothetical protein
MIPFLHTTEAWMGTLKEKFGVKLNAWVVFILGLSILLMAYIFMPNIVGNALSLALFIAPVWLPLLLITGAWKLWIVLKRSEFIASFAYVLLEIKPPRNLVKTPLAMEAFLASLHLTGGEATWWARFNGGTRPFWSLEIASFEGQVHFFIWGRASFRRMVESQLYAQYPGVQIVEAIDYTRRISAKKGEWDLWGCDFKKSKANPLPIKTYIEYGLDKVQKEPEQVDPIANLIEFMASIGKGEYLWLQFVIRAHRGERYGTTPASNKSSRLSADGKRSYTWIEEGKEFVEVMRKATRDSYIDMVIGEERPGFPNPTKGQSETMAAIERNISKLAFDIGGRGIYISRPENFNGATIGHLIALFKPFNTEGWNDINSGAWLKTFDDYPWEIGAEKKKDHYRHELVEAFRRRQFFYDPFFEGGFSMHETSVMSTEEIATIYHIPSAGVQTPSLGRIQSSTGEAPSNLPI